MRHLFWVLALAAAATAEDWHGFDPAGFGGLMLKAEQLKAMAEEARQVRPPKNGDHYVFAFANLQRDMAFGIKVEEGIKANADSAGVELLMAIGLDQLRSRALGE